MATINYCNYEIKGTLSTTSTITAGGIITAPGGTSTQWNTGYDRSIVSFSDSGSSTITLTLTRQDGTTYQTAFGNPQGTVTSVGISHGGNAFNVGSAITTNGTLAITMAGNSAQYVRGDGNLATFPSIPQGDITNVSVTSPITGGGSSGSVTIGHATSGVTAATYTAATIAVNATGHITSASSNTIPTNNNQLTNGAGYITSASLPTVNDATITIAAGNKLTGGAAFTTNQGSNETITLGLASNDISQFTNNSGYVTSSGVTSVATGSGLTGGTFTSTGTVSVDYGTSGLIADAPAGTGTPDVDDFILIGKDSSGSGETRYYTVGDLPFTNTSGDITAVTAGTLLDGGGTSGAVTLNVDLSELSSATGDMASTDFFVITRANNTQFKTSPSNIPNNLFPNDAGYTTNIGDITAVVAGNKLTGGGTSGSVTLGLASDNISQFTNDSGYTTNVGDITGVTAGTNLTGGGTSGTVTLNMATGGVGSGSYGSTSNSTKIDTITVDAYGRVTAVATGATGQVNSITSGNANTLTKSGTTSVTLTPNTGVVSSSSSNLATGAQIQTAINTAVTGVLKYDGVWNASTNSPTLSSGSGTVGEYYIVSVAGSTNLDGITDWAVGDWAVFSDQATDAWQKIDNTAVGSMSSWTLKEGNGTETSTVTNGETVTFAQGSGIQTELTSTSSGGTLTISNTITNNNQLTNGAGYTTNTGTTTASNSQTFTNKGGNISQWTNNSGYITSASLPTVNNGTLTMSTSAGLDGSATFTANQSSNSTFSVSLDLSELTDMTAAMTGSDEFIVLDSGAERRKAASEIGLSIFNNDAGFTTNVGDITGVTAGTGMSGGGTSGTVTLNCTITNNNQLTNGAGYTTNTGTTTATNTQTFTNKSGNISQWTNDAGYLTSAGSMSNWSLTADSGGTETITNGEGVDIAGGTNITTSRSGATVTITNGITNNNQLTNGSGYTTNTGTTTASNSQTFTNKGGNISQWTNDSGYTTNVGDITAVSAGTGLSGGGSSGSVTLNVDYLGTDSIIKAAPTLSRSVATNDIILMADPTTGNVAETTVGDLPFTNTSGDITAVVAGTGLSGGGTSGSVTLNNTITNNNQLTNGAGYTTYSGWNADGDSGSATVTSGGTLIFDGGTSQGITTLANNSGSGGTISFSLDIDNLTLDTGVQTSDFLALSPSSGATKKATIATILALAPQGDITNVSAGDGLSGGGSSGSVSLAVDSTVVRTSGNQSISGTKSFNSTTNINSDLDMEGGNDILLSGSGRISIDGDYGSAGQVLTSSGSVQEWTTPSSGGITGSGVSGRIPVFSGTSSVTSDSAFAFNTSTNVFTASKIAYTPVQQFMGFTSFPFSATPGNTIKIIGLSSNASTTNVSSPQGGGYYVMPQDGRLKQVVIRNTKDTPVSHSTRIKVYKNGSNSYTSSYQTGTGTNSVGWYVDFDDINHSVSKYDRFQLAFQGSNSATDWKGFAITVIWQFENYEY